MISPFESSPSLISSSSLSSMTAENFHISLVISNIQNYVSETLNFSDLSSKVNRVPSHINGSKQMDSFTLQQVNYLVLSWIQTTISFNILRSLLNQTRNYPPCVERKQPVHEKAHAWLLHHKSKP